MPGLTGTTGVPGPTGPTGANGLSFSGPTGSILWSPNGISVTGTIGLQYSDSKGITMNIVQFQNSNGNNAIKVGAFSTSIGTLAGGTGQAFGSVSVGTQAGQYGQQNYGIAIGYSAAQQGQGQSSIAIGRQSGGQTIQDNNTIILNASGTDLPSQGSDSLYIKPIRTDPNPSSNGFLQLWYDPGTGEIVYG